MAITINNSGITFPDGTVQDDSRGKRQYLATLTASNSASLNYTGFTNTYNHYDLVFNNIMGPSAAEQGKMLLRYYVSGAYQTTSYVSYGWYVSNGSSSATMGGQTAFIILDPYTYNVAGGGLSGLLTMVNARDTTKVTNSWHQLVGLYYTAGNAAQTQCGGYWNSAAAVDGFQVFPLSGSIVSGSIDIYGWN